MTGLPDDVTVEIEFISGSWVDVSAYVAAEQMVGIRGGRTTEFEDVGPATCTLVLRNDDGRFTPDSAGSPYFPYVTEGRRLRVTLTESAVAYQLFTGPILSWEPQFIGGMLANSTVTVSANDPLAQLALHTFDSRHVESARALARTASTWVDIYRMAGDATTRAWNNIGFITTGGTLGTAALIPATSGVGELAYAVPDSLVIESGVDFKPVAQSGFVAQVTPGGTPKAVSFWLKVDPDAVVASNLYVLLLRGAVSNIGSLRLYKPASSINLTVFNSGSSALSTLVTGVNDGLWRFITLTSSGASTVWSVSTAAATVTYTAAHDMTTAASFYLGGESAAGLAVDCAQFSAAGLCVAGDATVVPVVTDALAAQTHSHTDLFTTLQSFVPEVTSWAATGVNLTTLGEPAWAGSTALAVLQLLARSVTGVAYADGSGTVTLAANDIVRPTSPAATLDIEEDLDATSTMPTLRRSADSRPTRVTVKYAGGSTTLIDTAAEADGRPRREQTLETCCEDSLAATNAGEYLLTVVNGLRITQVSVDLTTTVQDVWAAFLTIFPTQTFVLDGFDAALIGATSLTVYAQGWRIGISQESVVYTLDCSPGGEYVAALWDAGDEYGRWSGDGTMTVTSGTAIGTTANGTLVITTSGGNPVLSTSSGDYPLYLDWDGEKVQITSPPGSSSSPQTVTTTARGVVPTAARSGHIAGESIDTWHAALWGS